MHVLLKRLVLNLLVSANFLQDQVAVLGVCKSNPQNSVSVVYFLF